MDYHRLLNTLHRLHPTVNKRHNVIVDQATDKVHINVWLEGKQEWQVIILDAEDEVKSYGRMIFELQLKSII
jgi:hypothetical protein